MLDDPQILKILIGIKSFWTKSRLSFISKTAVYRLVNLDLSEGEMYFEKSQIPVYSPKRIFVNLPFDEHFKTGLFVKLKEGFESCIEVGTNDDFAKGSGAIKLDSEIFSSIRNFLLFIADSTPLSTNNTTSSNEKWLENSNVMLELGFALAVKLPFRIITYAKSKVDAVQLPFDLQSIKSMPYVCSE